MPAWASTKRCCGPARSWPSASTEISEEFIQINFEQRAGKPRIEAWQSMADSTQLDTVNSFVHMLAQTDRFGTPLVRALRVFRRFGLRQKRRQQAEELGAKTTVKLIFPLVLIHLSQHLHRAAGAGGDFDREKSARHFQVMKKLLNLLRRQERWIPSQLFA
jgi:hypothetical protein